METVQGDLRKMAVTAETPVLYRLPVGGHEIPLNQHLGKTLRLTHTGVICCVACGQQTRRSFNQGYCFRCFTTLAQCDLCIVKPELCHYAAGTCREPEWGLAHCMRPHYVYLANSSGVKVGITRASQVPTRWIDQGAVQALLCFRVASRHHAGLLEVALKKYVTDRTDWRRMLKGEPAAEDLKRHLATLLVHARRDLADSETTLLEGGTPAAERVEEEYAFRYPVLGYPSRITTLTLDKTPRVEGTLLGVKGQYLLLDTGVLNVRKFAGYQVAVSFC